MKQNGDGPATGQDAPQDEPRSESGFRVTPDEASGISLGEMAAPHGDGEGLSGAGPQPQARPKPGAGLVARVPASTSNLGPGFDCLGLSLCLFNDFRARVLEDGPSRFSGLANAEGAALEANPFFLAFNRACALIGAPPPPVDVSVAIGVPVGAGLGSSATACVAGALAADCLHGSPLGREGILGLLIEIDGHPDNVTPSLYGGLTLTAIHAGAAPVAHLYAIAPEWRLALLIPDYPLPTARMRKALPKNVRLRDAVFNLARLPLLIDALVAGDAVEAGRVLEDRLHERYRAPFVKRQKRVRAAAIEAGAAATFISGAGPTLAALCLGEASAQAALDAMLEAAKGAPWAAKGLVAKPERAGAVVADLD